MELGAGAPQLGAGVRTRGVHMQGHGALVFVELWLVAFLQNIKNVIINGKTKSDRILLVFIA